MRPSVQVLHERVDAIDPFDDLEAVHKAETLRWLESTDDVYRRAKPATPDRHLVAYFPIIDSDDGASLLVDHINAGLHLPPGGHVEPDEDPVDTVRREAREELQVEARFATAPPRPAFITVTVTTGIDHGHTDVSLWFVLTGRRGMDLAIDQSEARTATWWTPAAISTTYDGELDPHYKRFMTKLGF